MARLLQEPISPSHQLNNKLSGTKETNTEKLNLCFLADVFHRGSTDALHAIFFRANHRLSQALIHIHRLSDWNVKANNARKEAHSAGDASWHRLYPARKTQYQPPVFYSPVTCFDLFLIQANSLGYMEEWVCTIEEANTFYRDGLE